MTNDNVELRELKEKFQRFIDFFDEKNLWAEYEQWIEGGDYNRGYTELFQELYALENQVQDIIEFSLVLTRTRSEDDEDI